MKHAAMLASKPDLDMEEAKRVHTSLRKASGKVWYKKSIKNLIKILFIKKGVQFFSNIDIVMCAN